MRQLHVTYINMPVQNFVHHDAGISGATERLLQLRSIAKMPESQGESVPIKANRRTR